MSVNSSKKLKCMYTKHLVKKRKSWNDGFLKIIFNNNTAICTLVDVNDIRQVGLESRQLELAEINKINKREEFTLELEHHLVQIESYTGEEDKQTFQPPLKLPKFSVPKFVPPKNPPPLQLAENRSFENGKETHSFMSTSGRLNGKSYKINNTELDDIWGSEDVERTVNVAARHSFPSSSVTTSTSSKTGVTVTRSNHSEVGHTATNNIASSHRSYRSPGNVFDVSGGDSWRSSASIPSQQDLQSNATCNDLYSSERKANVSVVPAVSIIGCIDASIWDD